MGLPVTVYRYTDAGAPQLVNNTPSEWINVLKKVLVEGYGDKQPLGWTLEFEDAGVRAVAFRNSTTDGGSGGYVKFYSVDGSDTANRVLGIKCALGMNDINTFFKPLFARGLFVTNNYKGWEIIGTKRGFYLILHYTVNANMTLQGTTSDNQVYFIGDMHSAIPNDVAPFTIVNGTGTNGDATTCAGMVDTPNTLYAQLYSADGSSVSTIHSFNKSYFYKDSSVYDGDAESLGINHLMHPVFIFGLASQNNNVGMPIGRGVVPGFHVSSFAGYRSATWPKVLNQNGVDWILLRSYRSPQFWVSAGTWYD
ncbi:hypothetical protein [Shewanella sp. Shew256]|uniref:hypothetical protein n=1 Tax=Shewanella sp. Shew256 TaxID=1969376 RepID=UPI000B4A51CE|nr:hypothetical protein [Shewanella sp. Shew256]